MPHYDGYIRVSKVRGRSGASFISPDVQKSQISGWAKSRGVTIAAWHEDLDVTGAVKTRPGLEAAMERALSGSTSGIVVAKFDRFFRSLVFGLDALSKLDAAGADFVSVSDGLDRSTPVGKMMVQFLLALAEFERERVSESWEVARGRAVGRGVHIASKTPTGYLRDEEGVLFPHIEYAPAIAEMFALRARGASYAECARLLNSRGVFSPYGNCNWQTGSITALLENRVYLGEARHGKFVNPHAHAPLVDRKTFERAQRSPMTPAQRSKQEPSLLAGLLRCSGCRHAIKGDTMRDHSGAKLRMYRCRGKHTAGPCLDRSAVLGRVIEPVVEAKFLEVVGRLHLESSADDAELATAVELLENAEHELSAYRDDERISGALGPNAYVDGLQVRALRVDAARATVVRLQAKGPAGGLPSAAELSATWPELGVLERRAMLQSVFGAIFLRSGRRLAIEDRVLFFPRGTEPDDLPRRGRRELEITPLSWVEPD